MDPVAAHATATPPPDGPRKTTSDKTRRRRRHKRPEPEAPARPAAPTGTAGAGGVDDIMKHVRAHKEYTLPLLSSKLRNLPEFESLSAYGIASQKADLLWSLEASRLLAAADGSHALLFEDESLGAISAGRYDKMCDVARRVQCGLMISLHDNMVVMTDHKPTIDDDRNLNMSTWYLRRQLNQPAEANGTDSEGIVLCCHALINYMTAVFARLLASTVDNTSWKMTCLAITARMATKMKVMCRDTRLYASRSLRHGGNVETRQLTEMQLRMQQKMGLVADSEDSEDEGQGANICYAFGSRRRSGHGIGSLRPGEIDDVDFYTGTIGTIRRDFYRVFDIVLWSFMGSNLPGVPIESFEQSILLSRTSFERSSFAVSQDRRGQIAATAGVASLHNTNVALLNLRSTIEAVQRRLSTNGCELKPPPTSSEEVHARACVRWQKIEDDAPLPEERLELSQTCDIISIVISAACTFPTMGNLLDSNNKLGNLLYQHAVPTRVSNPEGALLFSIASGAYEDGQPEVTSIGGVQSISRSLLARRDLVSLQGSPGSGGGITEKNVTNLIASDGEESLRAVGARREALRKLSDTIESHWQFDDGSVTIGCWKYAGSVGTMCAALVGGGLAVGFAVGGRIEAVDPFNITVFCWALAAFVLVVAKSARVQDWPWRDFLRGRVVCRSLSELCAVTGEDRQDVLAWLLQNEAATELQTRGPYNKLFQRRGDWGFAVDCAVQLATMVLSGIVVLEVQTQIGPALVCLDVRPGVEYREVLASTQPDNRETTLACIQPPSKDNLKAAATLLPAKLGWSNVLGIYNVPTRMFR